MIYTKCIFLEPEISDGKRISVMSRHTLNDGITPDSRITSESYDDWCQGLAPPVDLVGSHLRNEISWEEYERRYLDYVRSFEIALKVRFLAKDALETTITFLCSEEKADRCHRRLLAEECTQYQPNLEIKHL